MSVLTNSLSNINVHANAMQGGRNGSHHLFPLKDSRDGPNVS